MSTSGTYVFSQNRDQLLIRSLRLAGAVSEGESDIDSAMITEAAQALNSMVKLWQATGIHIWRTVEATLFLQANQARYELATTSTDHAAEISVETTLAVNAADGANAVIVSSATGMSVGYNIGVQVDDGTIHWTTISTLVGTTVGLTAPLDDSATAGLVVLVYQNRLARPLKILSARLYNFVSGLDTPVEEMDRQEYFDLPSKAAAGHVNGYFYDRRGGANQSGLLYVWQPSPAVEECLKMTVARPVQDFTAAGDDADLPQEWIEAIVWNLAENLAIEYDAPDTKLARIERKAAQFLGDVNWWEKELTEIQLVVGR